MEGSDPDVTKFLLGLLGDNKESFLSPFQLADAVRRQMISGAEQAGSKALAWDITQCNKIGGSGTLTSVWRSLKSDERTSGRKRSLSFEKEDDDMEIKKCRLSLNMRKTCEGINNIELNGTRDCSLSASIHNDSQERTEEEFLVLADSNGSTPVDESCHQLPKSTQ